MWYSATVTVQPASEPVSEAEARAHCGVADIDMAVELPLYIASARAYVEAYCGTPVVSRTVTIKCDSFSDFAELDIAPVSSISGISYIDSAGATQTLSSDIYEFRSDALIASITLKSGQSWPAIKEASRITVTAVVGYTAIPADIKHAMLLIIGQSVEGREPVKIDGATTADWLLANHRIFA